MRFLVRLLCAALLTTSALSVISASTLLGSAADAKTWAGATDPDVNPRENLNEFENRILTKVNRARARRDLPRVRVFQSCVDRYSERWAGHLKRSGKFVHRNQSKILDGCNVRWVGEAMVRWEALTPRNAVRLWMHSRPHRQILLKSRARWAGIGVRKDNQGRYIAVLNFADKH